MDRRTTHPPTHAATRTTVWLALAILVGALASWYLRPSVSAPPARPLESPLGQARENRPSVASDPGPAISDPLDHTAFRVPLDASDQLPTDLADWLESVEHVRNLIPKETLVASLVGREVRTERDASERIDLQTAKKLYEALVKSAAAAHYYRSRNKIKAERESEMHSLMFKERVTRTDILLAVLPDLGRLISTDQVDLQLILRSASGTGLGSTLDRTDSGAVAKINLHLAGDRGVMIIPVVESMVPGTLWRKYLTVLDDEARAARARK